jgi:hypothetical protein
VINTSTGPSLSIAYEEPDTRVGRLGAVKLLPLKFEVASAKFTKYDAHLIINVLERDTGSPLQIAFHTTWNPDDAVHYASVEEFQRAMVKRVLLMVFEHELEELLLVHGERRDPHTAHIT